LSWLERFSQKEKAVQKKQKRRGKKGAVFLLKAKRVKRGGKSRVCGWGNPSKLTLIGRWYQGGKKTEKKKNFKKGEKDGKIAFDAVNIFEKLPRKGGAGGQKKEQGDLGRCW